MKNILSIFIFSIMFSTCSNSDTDTSELSSPKAQAVVQKVDQSNDAFKDYWYQGKAEVNRYTLEQNRYKDVHPGEAIVVFVTEDFLTDKQVKNDNYTNPNSIPIMKNNFIRKFSTGLYDYSMMSSIFTPVEEQKHPHTLKITTSSQEWCGHTFMQINKQKNNYKTTLHSYFESEGDAIGSVALTLTEDELFNRIRINPQALPTGKIKMLPSTVVSRLMHLDFKPLAAQASLENYKGKDFEGEGLKVYHVNYPGLKRQFEIVFEAEAPYQIIGWTDEYPSMFDRKLRKTIARRTHSIMSAYWSKNGLNDMALREQLGI